MILGSCSLPRNSVGKTVQISHGGGGSMMQKLLREIIFPAMATDWTSAHDAHILPAQNIRTAFTTDSYVVQPYFFSGGDIGSLAVYGTVNDLAMAGASAAYISCGLILEEGFPLANLERILRSMKEAADECQVRIVTGDTKVVEKGKGDGIFINTSGVGYLYHEQVIAPQSICDGDAVILSGDIGRHGATILAARNAFQTGEHLESDCGSLKAPVLHLLEDDVNIHCLRDLTRGGLASSLFELSEQSGLSCSIQDSEIAISDGVKGLSEVLGIDPLYTANEGRFVLVLPKKFVAGALEVLKGHHISQAARVIGHFHKGAGAGASVNLFNDYGGSRRIPLLSGEQLPRIC